MASARFAVLLFTVIPAVGAEIPKGAHLLLRMVNSVNTRTASEGDYVYLRTATPIAVDGEIVVPLDSYVQGVVSHTRRSGRVTGRAELGIRLESLTFPGGRVVKLSPHLSSVESGESGQRVGGNEGAIRQDSERLKDAATIAVLAGSGAAIGGIADRSWKGAGIGGGTGSAVGLATVLLSRGKEVALPQGSTMDVVFDRPLAIE